jgi:EmrB/QacA subfamily drug resistance transporter
VVKRIEYKWVVATIFVLGLFMEIMDTTIINVAIPTLAEEFKVNAASMEWVVIGYLLPLAVWIPASGWIGDRFGTKKTFLFALFLFTVASMLCGVAQNMEQLIAFRVLQGVGGGMLTPVGTAMLYRSFPPEERARASTVLIVPTVIAPALGPVIGGAIVDHLSWRWIFYVNLPIGIAGFVFGALFLKEHREPQAGRFDLPGFVLSGAGLALFLYAITQGPSHGWASTSVLVTGIGGLLLIGLLIKVELTVAEPMLALRLYRDRIFRNANMVNSLSYGSFMAFLFLLPQMLQGPFGLSALETGLSTLPQALGVILMSQIVGRLYHTVGPRRLITTGLVVTALVTVPFVLIDAGTNLWLIPVLMFVRGCGMSFTFVSLQSSTYANIEARDTGRASAIFSTQRQASAAIGVAVLATVFITQFNRASDTKTPVDATMSAYHLAFLVSIGFAIAAAFAAHFYISDKDAARTMRSHSGS